MTNGYFLGVKPQENKMLLCFRDSETNNLIFSEYGDWHPGVYLITDEIGSKYFEDVAKRGLKTPQKTIRFKDVEIIKTRYGKFKGKSYAVKMQLEHFNDKNSLAQALKKSSGGHKMWGIYPDLRLPHEEAFYSENKMGWQKEYELNIEKTDKRTPDGSIVYELKSFEPTGKINENIPVLAYDIESDVKSWKTICISFSSPQEDRVFMPLPPNYKGSPQEFLNEFVVNNKKYKYIVDKFELDNKLNISQDLQAMYNEIGLYTTNAFKKYDVFTGYNIKDYDQRQWYREFEELGIKWYGKGGWPLTLYPVTDVGMEFRDPFTWNFDLLRWVNKGRISTLHLSQRGLKDIEQLFDLPPRISGFKSIRAGDVYENLYKLPLLLGYNIEDCQRARLIAESVIKGVSNEDL